MFHGYITCNDDTYEPVTKGRAKNGTPLSKFRYDFLRVCSRVAQGSYLEVEF